MSDKLERLRITVARPVYGGDVLGHAPDGRVVFTRGAAPSDQVEGRIIQRRKRFLRLEAEVITPGSARVAPFCRYFGRCGGCPWQAIPLDAQRAALMEHVTRGISHAAPGPIAPLAGFADQGWRATARLQVKDGQVGFFAHREQTLVPIARCPLFTPTLNRLLEHARQRLRGGDGVLRLSAALGAETGTLSARGPLRLDAPLGGPCHGGALNGHAFGDTTNPMGPARAPHPAGGFVQAHQEGNAALVAAACHALEGAGHVLELFAGAGNFSVALAEAGHRVTAVESAPAAIEALSATAKARGLPIITQASPAAAFPPGPYDAALIDPPREGAAELIGPLSSLAISRLVYISCDPATLIRDLAGLAGRGWRLIEARPFDLFPHSGHVEVFAVLARGA